MKIEELLKKRRIHRHRASPEEIERLLELADRPQFAKRIAVRGRRQKENRLSPWPVLD
jgi:hypothetical protein